MELSMHHRLAACLVPLALFFLPLVASAQTVSGVVHASSPLEGVQVQAELDGHPLPQLSTGTDGHFSLPLDAAKATSDLSLSFAKSGFRPQTRLLSVATASAKALDVVLEPLTGQRAISDAERAQWEPQRTAAGNGPLIFVPYSLHDGTPAQAAELNSRLPFQLQRLIVTRLQSILPDDVVAQVALKPVTFAIATDLERLRTFGEYVNALGVVSGQGIADSNPTGATIEFSSIFLIIPHSSQFEPPGLWINDEPVPAASIGRVSLDPKLSKDWSRAVVVALASRDLKNVEALPPPERATALRKIRSYLTAERADVGSNEGKSAAALQQLITLVNKAMTP
jgi:hypothetical protein